MASNATVDGDRLLTTFLELVQIDSPSGDEEEIGRNLMGRFRALGCQAEQDEVGNIIAHLSGHGTETILLSSHMDTVGTDRGIKPIVRDGMVFSEGDTILGADDKSGIAVILEILNIFRDHPELVHPPLEIVISVGEEQGLQGAKRLDISRLHASWGIVLDSGGPIGTLIYTAPSQNFLSAVVHGKKAHAGSEPESGVNAILVAAEALCAMPLGRIDEETTSNIGVISGGVATNIVPDEVFLRGEARSRDNDKLETQTKAMADALEQAAAKYGATVDLDIESVYRTYVVDPDQPPYQSAARAITSLGFELLPKSSGGGTDGNIYNAAGIPCIALSTGMADVHTSEEHIAVQDMIDSAKVLLQVLLQDSH